VFGQEVLDHALRDIIVHVAVSFFFARFMALVAMLLIMLLVGA
jgi:hypothetical protein